MLKWFYKSREERSRWLVEKFKNEIVKSKSLLDVGCYNADLKLHLPLDIHYIGIDIAGKPDYLMNLDKIKRFPFADKQFDMVVCADVLEHLENIHFVFDEICRVSSDYIVITLPNAYAGTIDFFRKKKYSREKEKLKAYGMYSKFYGLPLEIPQDRHRWFFSFDEGVRFLHYRASRKGFEILSVESEWKYLKRKWLERFFLSFIRLYSKNWW